MTGIEIALLVSSLAGAAGGLIGGGSDQEINSFEGTQLDPVNMGVRSSQLISGAGDVLAKRAGKGIQLRGVGVQQPGGYSGGGLPMNIGLSGSDPALKDPSMLTRPGVDFGNMFGDINKSFGEDASQGGRRRSPGATSDGEKAVPRGQGVPDPSSGGFFDRIRNNLSPNPITTDPTGSHEEALNSMRRLGFKV